MTVKLTKNGSVLILLAALCLFGFVSAAHAAAPAWKVRQMSVPSVLQPGTSAPFRSAAKEAQPEYNALITNVGGAAAAAGVTITDELPDQVATTTTSPEIAIITGAGPNANQAFSPCSVSGRVVTCVTVGAVPPGSSIGLWIPLEVDQSAVGSAVNVVSVVGGNAPPAGSRSTTPIGSSDEAFGYLPGYDGFNATATQESGEAQVQAGSHPFLLNIEANFNSRLRPGTEAEERAVGSAPLRNFALSLPSGVVFNPRATPVRCTESQLVAGPPNFLEGGGCPPQSQVGTITVTVGNAGGVSPLTAALYNMVPPPGSPAELAFETANTFVHIRGGLDGSFHLTAESRDILSRLTILGLSTSLWGTPGDPRHDEQRSGNFCRTGCAVENQTEVPLLTMPSSCSNSVTLNSSAVSWEEQSAQATGSLASPQGTTAGVSGCELLQFRPSAGLTLESRASHEPAGLTFSLQIPQNQGTRGLASATLKQVSVELPKGVAVSPSAAAGLGACSPGFIGLGNSEPAACPPSSKIGTAEVVTPLLESPLSGSIYLAEQRNNPFQTLLAVYLVVEGEGVVIKLAGKVQTDPVTGQLVATFSENPPLPFSELKVHFNGGPRATLSTPQNCGTYTANTELISWASSRPVLSSTPIVIDQNCTSADFAPKFEAGTLNPVGGDYSPFLLRVVRADREQQLSSISAVLPEGLLAKLAGIQLCGESSISSSSCPAASQVGSTTTSIGVGSQPLVIPEPGKRPTAVYLAGPYKGAPYSLVFNVPAEAGPFDLGDIVVRVALNVDPLTARVTATSDSLPQIIEGIPIQYRDVQVDINRSNFVLNPTSCDPLSINSILKSTGGGTSEPSSRFQASSCERLPFGPRISLALKGSTKRTGHPSLKAVVRFPPDGTNANISRAQVSLPHSEFLDQGNLNNVCRQADLRAGACPKSSIYGRAKAWTPLLSNPLVGNVYLTVGFGYKLPALVADLNGDLRILLVGKVDSNSRKGIRTTFLNVPDAPVSRFILELRGGKRYGLLQNSENVCASRRRADALFRGQNGKYQKVRPRLTVRCRSKRQAKRQ